MGYEILEYLVALFSVFFASATGYADGITDSGINKPGFHEGHKDDDWHKWSRTQSVMAFNCGLVYADLLHSYFWWPYLFVLPFVLLSVFWVAFRVAVYNNGKWEEWYTNETGYKSKLSPLLLKIIKMFS